MDAADRIEGLGRLLEKVLERHPEANRETVWRILRDLEETRLDRLRRGLRFGNYALS